MTHPYGPGFSSPGAHPGYYGEPSPPPPPSRLPQILAAIAAVVAVAAVISVVVLLLRSPSGNDDQSAGGVTNAAGAGGVTVVDPQRQGQPQTTVTVVPPVTVTTTAPRTTQQNGGGPAGVAGADSRGFTSGPRCNDSADPLLFAGYTSRSRVVVCQVGSQVGRNYYKGYADGNTIEVGYPVRSGSTFTATNGAISYIVSPSSLVITRNGSIIGNEPMIQSWVN